jgi:2,3-bisphosphoglycerate-independent phosphoglycerate mutase
MIQGPALRADDVREFNEPSCRKGALGIFPAVDVMPLALAHAGRLMKFGA